MSETHTATILVSQMQIGMQVELQGETGFIIGIRYTDSKQTSVGHAVEITLRQSRDAKTVEVDSGDTGTVCLVGDSIAQPATLSLVRKSVESAGFPIVVIDAITRGIHFGSELVAADVAAAFLKQSKK